MFITFADQFTYRWSLNKAGVYLREAFIQGNVVLSLLDEQSAVTGTPHYVHTCTCVFHIRTVCAVQDALIKSISTGVRTCI